MIISVPRPPPTANPRDEQRPGTAPSARVRRRLGGRAGACHQAWHPPPRATSGASRTAAARGRPARRSSRRPPAACSRIAAQPGSGVALVAATARSRQLAEGRRLALLHSLEHEVAALHHLAHAEVADGGMAGELVGEVAAERARPARARGSGERHAHARADAAGGERLAAGRSCDLMGLGHRKASPPGVRREPVHRAQSPGRGVLSALRQLHELRQRRLDALGDDVEVGQRVVVAEQAEADLAVVGDDRDRERALAGQERDREDLRSLRPST